MRVYIDKNFLFVRSKRRLAAGSRDGAGYYYVCIDLLRPHHSVAMDVEISHATRDYLLGKKMSLICSCDPAESWTRLEVLAKLHDTPVHVLLVNFLNQTLSCEEIQTSDVRTIRRDVFILSFAS